MLEEILVKAEPRPSRDLEIAERHRIWGGRLARYDELRQQEHLPLEDVLRRLGVRVETRGRSAYPVSNRPRLAGSGAQPCYMSVFLDGVMVGGVNGALSSASPTDLSQFTVQVLGAVEVYKSGVSTPMQYSSIGNSCGVVLLWTRDH